MRDTLGVEHAKDFRPVLTRVLMITAVIELLGATLLLCRFAFELPLGQAIWHAVFHSVSAYCNAGFSLRSDNLMSFRDDPLVNLTICGLIVTGGLGVPVITDLMRWSAPLLRNPFARRYGAVKDRRELRLHTKLTLTVTAVLLFGGTAIIAALEWNGALRGLPLAGKLLVPFQHSTSCRTAGFNTIDLNQFGMVTLFLSIALMIIGGGACSTAGGMKVTTVGLLVSHAFSRMRGRSHLNIYRRTVPSETIERALTITILFGVIASVLVAMLIMTDPRQSQPDAKGSLFVSSLFEVCSALGTVGLSLGLTVELSDLGRLVIMAGMFIGRLGPFAVFAATSASEQKRQIEYAKDEPLLG
jgi:trk system potassium uptake protein TrkH